MTHHDPRPDCVPARLLTTLWVVLLATLCAAGSLVPAARAQGTASSCVQCHGDEEWFGDEGHDLLLRLANDVHTTAGLGCHDCHGGNPASELADDLDAAMDSDHEPNPYRGAVDRAAIPAFCGRCHSDVVIMRRFAPDPRVDQEREYWTSGHGEALQAGNEAVATCVDCHGSHGILKVADPESPVYPLRVAETCSRCHSDPEIMATARTASGVHQAPGGVLRSDPYARWRVSVHATALLDKGDLSAPTCNDCHGNHGAVPPGVDSIAFVCGQCHGREARLFRQSAKKAGFEEHNEFIADLGDEGCAACHEEPEPQAGLRAVRSFAECATCHSNHAVIRPTIAMLGPLPEAPCVFCHEGSGPLAEAVPEPAGLQHRYEAMKASLFATAESAGLEGDERFDWLVDRALELPQHTLPATEDGSRPVPRPEFARLFDKLRIGKTSFTVEVGGELVREEILRCVSCHGPEPLVADQAAGYEVARETLDRMRQLTTLTARAERMAIRARRGGVETREALDPIAQAVDAQIGLEVLVHTFEAAEGSAFAIRQQEGLENATAALAAARRALDELAFRRRGLVISLAIILLLAAALAMKIRRLPE